MSEFDERLADAQGQPDDVVETSTAPQAPVSPVSDVVAGEPEVTVDLSAQTQEAPKQPEVDPTEVDEILAEITGTGKADAHAVDGEATTVANEAAAPSQDGQQTDAAAGDAPIDQTIPGLEVLSASSDAASPEGGQVGAVPSGAQAPAAPEAPKKKTGRRAVTVALALLVLVLGAYLAGVVTFMRVFMPGTTINGEDVSLKSMEEVAQDNSDSIDSFEFAVTGDGLDLQIKASDIKAAFDGDRYARTAMSQQHAWSWPLQLAQAHAYTVKSNLSFDAARLDDLVGSAVDAVNASAVESVDATFAFNKDSLRYEVTPEVWGTKIDKPAVLEKVRQAITTRESSVQLGTEVLATPTVLSDNEALVEGVKRANASLAAIQDIDYNAQTMHTLGAEDTHNWITLNADYTVSFDTEACTAWCRGPLSQRIDTVGSGRSFVTPDGREVYVHGGTYGWSLDGGELAQIIAENVLAGKSAHIEAPWMSTAAAWAPGGNEWGDTYVEIDLGAQHARYFSGGAIVWESDCVSGGLNDGKMHYTPTGVYAITQYMESGNVELRGEIDPATGKPEYISHVRYWMPFIGNSHALHDADWRSSFGGDIYLSSGSHGCVNLPVDKAAELYGMVGVGTVVVVHD